MDKKARCESGEVGPSIYRSIGVSIYPSIDLSIGQPTYLSIHLSVSVSTHVAVSQDVTIIQDSKSRYAYLFAWAIYGVG